MNREIILELATKLMDGSIKEEDFNMYHVNLQYDPAYNGFRSIKRGGH